MITSWRVYWLLTANYRLQTSNYRLSLQSRLISRDIYQDTLSRLQTFGLRKSKFFSDTAAPSESWHHSFCWREILSTERDLKSIWGVVGLWRKKHPETQEECRWSWRKPSLCVSWLWTRRHGRPWGRGAWCCRCSAWVGTVQSASFTGKILKI